MIDLSLQKNELMFEQRELRMFVNGVLIELTDRISELNFG